MTGNLLPGIVSSCIERVFERIWRQPHKPTDTKLQHRVLHVGKDLVMLRDVYHWCGMGPMIPLDTTSTVACEFLFRSTTRNHFHYAFRRTWSMRHPT